VGLSHTHCSLALRAGWLRDGRTIDLRMSGSCTDHERAALRGPWYPRRGAAAKRARKDWPRRGAAAAVRSCGAADGTVGGGGAASAAARACTVAMAASTSVMLARASTIATSMRRSAFMAATRRGRSAMSKPP
jgi:hypothetical protein